MPRLHLYVSGRVQGVFYRANTQERARELGLTGWVQNLPDGRVEIVAEGERPALESLLSWCRGGPPRARVDEVRPTWSEPTDEFDDFTLRR